MLSQHIGRFTDVRKTSIPVDLYPNLHIREVIQSFNMNLRTLIVLLVIQVIRPVAERCLMFCRVRRKRFCHGFVMLDNRAISWLVVLMYEKDPTQFLPAGTA